MAMRSVGFALETSGKAEVKSDFAEVKKAGQDAMSGIATSAEQAGNAAADAMERAERRQKASLDRQAANAKMAAAGYQANADVDGALGGRGVGAVNLDRSRGAAAASASVFAERFAQEEEGLSRIAIMEQEAARAAEQRAAAVDRLRSFIDPLYTAQKRYDDELRTWNSLLEAGEIDQARHTAAVQRSAEALDQARHAQVRGAANDNQRRAGLQQLSYQLSDVAAQAATGTAPLQIFAQQSGQVVGALQLLGGGSEGATTKFSKFMGVLGSPWVMIATAAATIAIPLIAKLFDTGEEAKKSEAKLRALGVAQDGLGDKTLSAANAIKVLNSAQLQDRSAAVASAAGSLAAQRQAQANATFNAARAEAQLRLAQGQARLADLADGSESSTRRVALNGGRSMVVTDQRALSDRRARGMGSELGNARELAQQQIAQARADMDALEKAYKGTSSRIVAQTIATDTQLRDARLRSASATDAVAVAQARRDGIERRAKIELDARVISETEYTARVAAANKAVDAAQEAAKGLTSARRDERREANEAAREAEQRATLVRNLVAGNEGGAGYATLLKEQAAILREWKDGNITDDAAQAAGQRALSKYVDGVEAEAERQASRLKGIVSSTISGAGPLVTDEQISKSLADTQKRLGYIKSLDPALKGLRDTGAQLVDKALSPDTWRNWASSGKSALREIEDAFIRLALINPLKNLITGGSSTTLTSLLKSAAGLFGGAGVDRSIDSFATAGIGRNAIGTQRWSGGLTYVNENGGEIMDLPGGTRIYPAAESRRMMDQASATPMQVKVLIETDDEMFTGRVASVSDSRIASAAPGIALGSAQMAQTEAGKRARYRYPGR